MNKTLQHYENNANILIKRYDNANMDKLHLTFREMEQTIQNMKKILKQNGKIIISYSLQREAVDDRFFEILTRDKMTELFNQNGFVEKEYFYNIDNMNRKIEWVTQVYKLGE